MHNFYLKAVNKTAVFLVGRQLTGGLSMKIKAKIYKKSKTNNWTLNYIDPKTNKRIRKSFKTQKSAKLYLEEFSNGIILKRRNREGDKKTLNDIIDVYLQNYPKSNFINVKSYTEYFREEFGNRIPKSITPSELRDWLVKIKSRKNYSLKSISNMKAQLQIIFKFMKREGYVASNPFKKIIVRGRSDFYRRDKLSQDDMKIIFENLYYYSPYFLYRLAYITYYTGISKAELVLIKKEHFDSISRKINIVSPKAGYVRSVVIPDHVANMLKSIPKRTEYLLCNRLGRKIDPNNIRRYLLRFRERYPQTPKFNLEDIKNAFAFHFLERGGSMNELSVILNHSRLDDTVRLFGRPRKVFWADSTATDEEISTADWAIQVID